MEDKEASSQVIIAFHEKYLERGKCKVPHWEGCFLLPCFHIEKRVSSSHLSQSRLELFALEEEVSLSVWIPGSGITGCT